MKSKFIKTTINEYYSETQTKFLTVYHGTKPKFVENIKENGINNRPELYTQGWYMVSTDFESALFHANPDSKKDTVYVFEFKIPVIDSIDGKVIPIYGKQKSELILLLGLV
jgi:hypothetical protein